MAVISPYTNQVNVYDFKPTLANKNWDLVSRVMLSKQDEFDKTYAGLNKLKNTVLNIQFLNDSKQKEMDGVNQEISKSFIGLEDGEFDLTKSNVVDNYMTKFNLISPELVNSYKIDKQVRNRIAEWNKLDPKDRHVINDTVFGMNVNEYKKATDNFAEKSNFSYQKYTDISKGMLKVAENVKPLKFHRDSYDGKGRKIRVTKSGKPREAVGSGVKNYLTSDGAGQIDINSEYLLATKFNTTESYNEFVGTYKGQIQEKLNNLTDKIKAKESLITGIKDSDLRMEHQEVLNALIEQKDKYQSKYNSVGNGDIERKNEVKDWLVFNHIEDSSNAYGGMSTSVSYSMDPLWKFQKQNEMKLLQMERSDKKWLASYNQKERMFNKKLAASKTEDSSNATGITGNESLESSFSALLGSGLVSIEMEGGTGDISTVRKEAERIKGYVKDFKYRTSNVLETGIPRNFQTKDDDKVEKLAKEIEEIEKEIPSASDSIYDTIVNGKPLSTRNKDYLIQLKKQKDKELDSLVDNSLLSAEGTMKAIIFNYDKLTSNEHLNMLNNPYVLAYRDAYEEYLVTNSMQDLNHLRKDNSLPSGTQESKEIALEGAMGEIKKRAEEMINTGKYKPMLEQLSSEEPYLQEMLGMDNEDLLNATMENITSFPMSNKMVIDFSYKPVGNKQQTLLNVARRQVDSELRRIITPTSNVDSWIPLKSEYKALNSINHEVVKEFHAGKKTNLIKLDVAKIFKDNKDQLSGYTGFVMMINNQEVYLESTDITKDIVVQKPLDQNFSDLFVPTNTMLPVVGSNPNKKAYFITSDKLNYKLYPKEKVDGKWKTLPYRLVNNTNYSDFKTLVKQQLSK